MGAHLRLLYFWHSRVPTGPTGMASRPSASRPSAAAMLKQELQRQSSVQRAARRAPDAAVSSTPSQDPHVGELPSKRIDKFRRRLLRFYRCRRARSRPTAPVLPTIPARNRIQAQCSSPRHAHVRTATGTRGSWTMLRSFPKCCSITSTSAAPIANAAPSSIAARRRHHGRLPARAFCGSAAEPPYVWWAAGKRL